MLAKHCNGYIELLEQKENKRLAIVAPRVVEKRDGVASDGDVARQLGLG
jgi:hypothetical protein